MVQFGTDLLNSDYIMPKKPIAFVKHVDKFYTPEKTFNISNISSLKHTSIVYYFNSINEEKGTSSCLLR